VCIVAASGQNIFFAELLDAVANALRASGLEVERSLDRFPPLRDDVVYLFVPHEYMPLVEPEAHPQDVHLARAVALCTEQPGTTWFDEAAAIAERAARTVDINPLGARELARRGVDVALMPLGYVPEWDTWGGDASAPRPVDVAFMGGYTPRRARALACCAGALVSRRAQLTITDSARPHGGDSVDFLSGERRWEALRATKVLVNIHRSELGYLEWLRVIGAIVNGCVVLTEHSVGFDPLIPGEHFVSADYERLPLAIEALLGDPERLAAIRTSAYRFVREQLPMSDTVGTLVRTIEETYARPRAERVAVPAPVPPMPRTPPTPPTEYQRIFTSRTDLDRIRAAVKELVLGQSDMRRRIERLGARDQNSAKPADIVEQSGPRGEPPLVSVLLTVYNYASLVRRAIASVARSDFSRVELVVVDDASTDDSVDVVRGELRRFPDLSATLVARGENRGLAEARNCALAHASGECVFILDADNEIYPHALGRLFAALSDTPSAAFAYGIIEQFGPEGPRDLISWRNWDPALLRYGNYIDAMAMIRRSALIDVGGYTRDRRLYGWEDFALWCTFAERGIDGVRVPEILSRYRTGVYSMLSTTDIDATAAWSALVECHPFLSR
jgi:hypothetical protein